MEAVASMELHPEVVPQAWVVNAQLELAHSYNSFRVFRLVSTFPKSKAIPYCKFW